MTSSTLTLIGLGILVVFGLIVLPLLIRRRRQSPPWEEWEAESREQQRLHREQEDRAASRPLNAFDVSRLHHLSEVRDRAAAGLLRKDHPSGVEHENDYDRVLARHPHGGYPHFQPQPHPRAQDRPGRRQAGSGGRRRQDQDSQAQDAGALASTGFLMAQAGSDDAGHTGHGHSHDGGGSHGSDAGSSGGDGGSSAVDCGGGDAGGGF